jgi:hypothetical protein
MVKEDEVPPYREAARGDMRKIYTLGVSKEYSDLEIYRQLFFAGFRWAKIRTDLSKSRVPLAPRRSAFPGQISSNSANLIRGLVHGHHRLLEDLRLFPPN